MERGITAGDARKAAAMVGLHVVDAPFGPELALRLLAAAEVHELAATMCRSIARGMNPDAGTSKGREQSKAAPVRQKISEASRRAVINMLASGVSIAETARRTGHPHGTVHGIAAKLAKEAIPAEDDGNGRPVPAAAEKKSGAE